MIRPTCAALIEKLAAISESKATGANSAVLKIKAARERLITLNQAVDLGERVMVSISKVKIKKCTALFWQGLRGGAMIQRKYDITV
ncbi:hypothetical protein [Brenneria roseae]|uniref:hypothetical protein n=1 Tax=Brenneria roseae TaxID=1509241 RepID=UPI001FFA050E|nr:hypothetical protein [Brenneria roseae]